MLLWHGQGLENLISLLQREKKDSSANLDGMIFSVLNPNSTLQTEGFLNKLVLETTFQTREVLKQVSTGKNFPNKRSTQTS